MQSPCQPREQGPQIEVVQNGDRSVLIDSEPYSLSDPSCLVMGGIPQLISTCPNVVWLHEFRIRVARPG